jgi:hypothetical protein
LIPIPEYAEYLKQFKNFELLHLYKEANTAIRSSALSGDVLVTMIPHPVFDAVAALWRATALNGRQALSSRPPYPEPVPPYNELNGWDLQP